jgi:hypothetical protein
MAGSDRETELAARLAALEERLAQMEAKAADAGARPDARPLEALDAVLDMLLPAEVRGHMRAARKEQLLAIRSMVDIWIERVDRKPEERRGPRRESIPLEDT